MGALPAGNSRIWTSPLTGRLVRIRSREEPRHGQEPDVDYLLGMDAGGTKTLCVLVEDSGRVAGVGRAACGNFQVGGRKCAQEEIQRSIHRAIESAGIRPDEVATAFYGISGADREADFRVVRDIVVPINPAARMFLENDTIIALRAGTRDGVGLGLISGTGTNAIGFNQRGKRLQVGGWGSPYLGDYGSAHDIAASAFALAQRGRDGRGNPTRLYDRLVQVLGVRELLDICERDFAESSGPPLDIASYAPLVFETAKEGDPVALDILRHAGKEISLAALAVLRALFQPDQPVPVVLGGSVFQKGSHPAMIDSLQREVKSEFPQALFKLLEEEPVTGAILFAADRHFQGQLPAGFTETLRSSMRGWLSEASHPPSHDTTCS